ncbi:MAG: hypothetical protein RQ875_11130 [Vicingaceae bacterium]|nr:hypothetical protein [Vicingaceae bacterium]
MIKLSHIITICILFTFFGCKVNKQSLEFNEVSSLIIYKRFFFTGGSTNLISYNLKKIPIDTDFIDITNVNTGIISDKEFSNLLRNCKAKKHYQKKIGGIDFSGEFKIGNVTHYFIVCGWGLIVDFTDKVEYKCTEENTEKFNHIVNKIKHKTIH